MQQQTAMLPDVIRRCRGRAVRRTSFLILLLAASAIRAGDDCIAPARPAVPDGATADHEAMLVAQQAVKAFQAANMRYMQCLEATFEAASRHARGAQAADEKARAQRHYERATDAYNEAVSTEEEVAGQFNIELREYRAKRR